MKHATTVLFALTALFEISATAQRADIETLPRHALVVTNEQDEAASAALSAHAASTNLHLNADRRAKIDAAVSAPETTNIAAAVAFLVVADETAARRDAASRGTNHADAAVAAVWTNLSDRIAVHTNRTDNPHGVTTAQIGAATYSALTNETAFRKRADALGSNYVDFVKGTLETNLASQITTHADRADNPHGVTPAQIGAATYSALTNETAARERSAALGSNYVDAAASALETNLLPRIAYAYSPTNPPAFLTSPTNGTRYEISGDVIIETTTNTVFSHLAVIGGYKFFGYSPPQGTEFPFSDYIDPFGSTWTGYESDGVYTIEANHPTAGKASWAGLVSAPPVTLTGPTGDGQEGSATLVPIYAPAPSVYRTIGNVTTGNVTDLIRILSPTNNPTFTGAIDFNGSVISNWPSPGSGITTGNVTDLVRILSPTNNPTLTGEINLSGPVKINNTPVCDVCTNWAVTALCTSSAHGAYPNAFVRYTSMLSGTSSNDWFLMYNPFPCDDSIVKIFCNVGNADTKSMVSVVGINPGSIPPAAYTNTLGSSPATLTYYVPAGSVSNVTATYYGLAAWSGSFGNFTIHSMLARRATVFERTLWLSGNWTPANSP